MKTVLAKYWKIALSFLLGIVVFLFWAFVHPEQLNYHEQNQLFLFSCDYFAERMSVPGGFADWLSEFLVQFYYYALLGAAVLALVFVALHRLIVLQFKHRGSAAHLASLIPLALLVWHMSDFEVLLSFPVAIILVLIASALFKNVKYQFDLVILPVLFWLAGPVTWVYVGLRLVHNELNYKFLSGIVWLALIQEFIPLLSLLPQVPTKAILLGINYYRVPEVYHALQFVIPAVIVLLPLLLENKVVEKWNAKFLAGAVGLTAIVLAFVGVNSFDKDYYEILKQDMLVRQDRWDDVIKRAEVYQVPNALSCNFLNLSLAMKRQLADRMFNFFQSGNDALIMGSVRDNMSNIATAEAFYQLSMTNSCLRYFSDLQESILNYRKSGRFTKRIAECHIVNGKYKLAQKHLDLLKQSLFYRSWALEAEACLGKEAMVNANPDWARMRKRHFKHEFLYSYPEIDKMIGQLFADNTDNKIALDYFMGNMLLFGHMQEFMGYLHFVQDYGGYTAMPYGYQDAATFIQSQGQAPGTAYGNYAQRMMATHGN